MKKDITFNPEYGKVIEKDSSGSLKTISNPRDSGKSLLDTLMKSSALLGGKSPLSGVYGDIKEALPEPYSDGGILKKDSSIYSDPRILGRTSAATGSASGKAITLEDLKRFSDIAVRGGFGETIITDEFGAKEASEPKPEPHSIVTESEETGSW